MTPSIMTNFGKLIETSTQTVSLKWELENYSSISEQKEVKTITSPMFNNNWHILFHPKGNEKATKGYISIYLCNDRNVDIKASFTFYVLNKAKEKIKVLNAVDTSFKKKGHIEDGWGIPNALKVSDLVDKQLIVNDTLTLLVQINTDEDDLMQSDLGKELHPFEKLLDSEEFSDVSFNVQNKKIPAHKAILSVRSSVFEAMFKHDMKENQDNVVEIEGVEYDVFMELLRFIYSGKVNDIEKFALDLVATADRYLIDDLKARCESVLISSISIDKVFDYLKVANNYNLFVLKNKVTDCCKKHASDVVKMPQFEEFTKQFPLLSIEVTRSMIYHTTSR